jgi:hypothetical protein
MAPAGKHSTVDFDLLAPASAGADAHCHNLLDVQTQQQQARCLA